MRWVVGLLAVLVAGVAIVAALLWMRVGDLEQETRLLRSDDRILDGGLRITEEMMRSKIQGIEQRVSALESR